MSERRRDFVLIGILICLIVIALKPVPQMSVNQTPAESPGESVVALAPNRIGIVDTNGNSGLHGTILVFDYDEKNRTFLFAGTYNYKDYFRNPHQYGIQIP